MKERKFIVIKDWNDENVELRLDNVFYYRELIEKSDITKHKSCYGGGKWDIDLENKSIKLYGSSEDFGRPDPIDVEEAVKNFDDTKWMQLSLVCRRLYIDEPIGTFDNMKDNFKFNIEY